MFGSILSGSAPFHVEDDVSSIFTPLFNVLFSNIFLVLFAISAQHCGQKLSQVLLSAPLTHIIHICQTRVAYLIVL